MGWVALFPADIGDVVNHPAAVIPLIYADGYEVGLAWFPLLLPGLEETGSDICHAILSIA